MLIVFALSVYTKNGGNIAITLYISVNVIAKMDILCLKLNKSEATKITCGEQFKLIVKLYSVLNK